MSIQPEPVEPSALPSRPEVLQDLRDSLRPGQQRMADWQSGSLAVSAVPGSGKSTGMAIAAAVFLAKRLGFARSG
jgi:DNA helicase II / ATP-dependent DNA helicase PcrA